MRRLALFATLLFPLAASAQFGDAPIQPDRTPLALTAEVPAIFHIGLGGDASVFVNPARAARAKHRFAYATVQPAFIDEAPVSFAGLFGRGERRWLIALENGVLSEDSESSRQEERSEQLGDGTRFIRETDSADESLRAVTFTRARVLLIGRTDFGGYAFGLYGGYRSRTNEALRLATTLQETDRTFPSPSMQSQNTQEEDERIDDTDRFGIGVETALAGRTWDLAGAVSYQRVLGDITLASLRTETTLSEDVLDDGTRRVRDADRFSQVASSRDAESTAVDAELIGTLRVGDRRDDYLYAAVSGTLGSGNEDYAVAFDERLTSVITENGTIVSESEEAQAFDDAGTLDLSERAFRASLGYVYARRGRNMTILAGLNPSGTFSRSEETDLRVGTVSSQITQRLTEVTELALTLPVYVRFGVTKRLDAFGGGLYAYTYTHADFEARPVVPGSAVPGAPTLTLTQQGKSDRFVSTGRLYGGAVFTFRSGFTAQASVRGNLADVTGWIVSMGYRF